MTDFAFSEAHSTHGRKIPPVFRRESMTRRLLASVVLTALFCSSALAADGWVSLFDGKSLDGWKASENKSSIKVEDGAIVVNGPRSHLFYMGDDKPFENFEFKAKVLTKEKANSGIYFHTKYQETGWPKFGYEAQVNNTHGDPKKTGSLYAVENILKAPAKDNEWFDYYIRVEGKNIVIKINDKTVIDYTEPEGREAGKDFTRVLDKGTFAFQAHDPISEVRFKDIQVRRLP
jgi:hypothetical protein